MTEPKELVDRLERGAELPGGDEERFAGFGVMGVPFTSGHLLTLRRFPASSLGSGYTSVWHRDPRGRWAFYSDVPPHLACPRYFGSAVDEAVVREIETTWAAPRDFSVSIEGEPHLDWHLSLTQTSATRMMNAMGGVLPDTLWRRKAVLKSMGKAASLMLEAGRLGLTNRAPNRQRFVANPMLVWVVQSSTARMGVWI